MSVFYQKFERHAHGEGLKGHATHYCAGCGHGLVHKYIAEGIEELGIRVVNQFETHEFRNMQLHPKDTGGSFFEIDEQVGPDAHAPNGPWEPAGPDWQAHRSLSRVSAIAAAEIQCDKSVTQGCDLALQQIVLLDS